MGPFYVENDSPLLDFLFAQLPDLKRTKIRQALKFGSIVVNGEIVAFHAHPLKKGDRVELLSKKDALAGQRRGALPFPVLYEDDDLIAVEKPSGLLTMGTEREKERTVYYGLTAYRRSVTPGGRGRVFIVHRLDRDASGIVLFAKTPQAKLALQESWENVVKKYYAVVEGAPARGTGRIESYLVEDKFRRVYSVRHASRNAQYALTHYRLVRGNGPYSLLDVSLETGRKNQIRVHCADIGCPIAGDAKYGARTDPLGRLCLHAYHLFFRHPVTGEPVTLASPIPREFHQVVQTG